MTARDILSPGKGIGSTGPDRSVDASMPVLDVIPLLLDSPAGELNVTDGFLTIGTIDRDSMLEGIGRLISARNDCSTVVVECRPEDYSAGIIAHAVEESDAHLVDLISTPSAEGTVHVTLRVRACDPSAAICNLERRGLNVISSHSASGAGADSNTAMERLLSLQTLLNV